MAIDINSLQSFTPSDMLKLVNHAIAQILAGAQSYTINGRQFSKADIGELRMWRQELMLEVESAGNDIAAVDFNR